MLEIYLTWLTINRADVIWGIILLVMASCRPSKYRPLCGSTFEPRRAPVSLPPSPGSTPANAPPKSPSGPPGSSVPHLQDEVLEPVGGVGYVRQRHVGLFRGAVVLAPVSPAARGHHVGPDVLAASRDQHDVVAGQLLVLERRAAVRTQVPIALEQLEVGVPPQGGVARFQAPRKAQACLTTT